MVKVFGKELSLDGFGKRAVIARQLNEYVLGVREVSAALGLKGVVVDITFLPGVDGQKDAVLIKTELEGGAHG